MHRRSLFLFRRDLRLEDNTALLAALATSAEVVVGFCFDPRQVNPHPYRSVPGLVFLYQSLVDLAQAVQEKGGRLVFWSGVIEDELARIIRETRVEAVYVNVDYTPFSRERDAALEKVCVTAGISFHSFDDALLHAPGEITKDDGTPYTVYTPFMKKSRTHTVRAPQKNAHTTYAREVFASEVSLSFLAAALPTDMSLLVCRGGRAEGLRLLERTTTLVRYGEERNMPALSGTTMLSPHHKFGTISARETYARVVASLSAGHTLINELYWRDFFTHIAWYFPHVFSGSFHKEYNSLPWNTSENDFLAWCRGETGYPLVDAGMRELNSTGYMHNRVRMVTASFLVKDLRIDWRKGERYFATKLADYDPAVNNGNWQWAASTGCDAQPYFRIFNPWLQQKTYDPDAEYIRRYVPELTPYSAKEIHDLQKGLIPLGCVYSRPIVDHKIASEQAKKMFAEAASRR